MAEYRGPRADGGGRMIEFTVHPEQRFRRPTTMQLAVDTISIEGIRGRIRRSRPPADAGTHCTVMVGGTHLTGTVTEVRAASVGTYWHVSIDYFCLSRTGARAVLDWMLCDRDGWFPGDAISRTARDAPVSVPE